jgi:hypothetical protein
MQTITRRWPEQLRCLALCCLIALAAPASAGPEQLEQLEPDGGEWQFEYSTLIGVRSEDEHSLQMLYGISDHLSVGVEVEAEWSAGRLAFEGVAPTILYRFSDASDAVGIGIGAQIEFDRDLKVTSAEARLILEKKTPRWWAQGNFIAHLVREDGQSAASLAYGWSLSRAIAKDRWIGAEGSGGLGRLGGSRSIAPDNGHFIGPALTFEREIAGSELEIGITWLHRIAGDGARNTARLFVQFGL